jgi:DNA-binding CsgD family transcriptional regulator
MTFGISALQRESGRHISSMTPPVASASQRPRPTGFDRGSPSGPPVITWIGPMEVMMEGCRYRLVPADAPANQTLPGNVEPLTPRETQIARLVADGFVNKEIASKLSISEWTVSTHMRRIFAKLGVETRAAMVLRCFGK